jgi:hypothetical protein
MPIETPPSVAPDGDQMPVWALMERRTGRFGYGSPAAGFI